MKQDSRPADSTQDESSFLSAVDSDKQGSSDEVVPVQVLTNTFSFMPEKNTAPIFMPSAAVFNSISKPVEFGIN
jgi:hypothetical protein